ncbi:MAG: GNAT family N-acetyltransferase [Anaerolineae bacterium]|nr:GNAT family N-acetyltransferase [Anaerolineae bacterium]
MNQSMFGQFPHLESQSLILRKIDPSDIDAIFAIYSNQRIFEYAGILVKKNRDTVLKSISHFERDFNKRTRIKWGIARREQPATVIGIIEATGFNQPINQVTIGYFLHPDYWHQGYATEAVRILCTFLVEDAGFNRIEAEVMPANLYSKKVLLKNGFVLEGVLRQGRLWPGKGIIDLEIYSLLAQDWHRMKNE